MSNFNIYKKDKPTYVGENLVRINSEVNYINSQYILASSSQYSEYFSQFIKNDIASINDTDINLLAKLLAYKNMRLAQLALELSFYNSI